MNEIRRHEHLRQGLDRGVPLQSMSTAIGKICPINFDERKSICFSLEKLPQFENFARIFDKTLLQSSNDKAAYHYYIQQSIRNVIRLLVQKNRIEPIKKVLEANNLLPKQIDLLDVLRRLRETAMERFLTTPFEEREKIDQIKSLNGRLVSNENEIKKLEKELAEAKAERDAEVSFHQTN